MKRTIISLCALSCVCALASGCSSNQKVVVRDSEPVALAMMGPMVEANATVEPAEFYLGAGDTLGQAIFTYYVAYVRNNRPWQFASGEATTER